MASLLLCNIFFNEMLELIIKNNFLTWLNGKYLSHRFTFHAYIPCLRHFSRSLSRFTDDP